MAYVITDTCIKDSLCVEVCPTDCIHPKTDEPGYEAATAVGLRHNLPKFRQWTPRLGALAIACAR
jgi:formate hydrogenlyase subunit 6/NADH:ubiquinone oxidoreductase subunit I